MSEKPPILSCLYKFFICVTLVFSLFMNSQPSWAKRPPEIRNQDDLNISKDMHGQDLSGLEFVKFDLRGIDFSEANLTGTVFNNSKLGKANLKGADMQDALAYATQFEDANLTDVNLTNALLMESSFNNTIIDGADFTDAVISRIQQKQLCKLALSLIHI